MNRVIFYFFLYQAARLSGEKAEKLVVPYFHNRYFTEITGISITSIPAFSPTLAAIGCFSFDS